MRPSTRWCSQRTRVGMKALPAVLLVGVAVLNGVRPVQAQQTGTTAQFAAGWNMIGLLDVSGYTTSPGVRYTYVNGDYQLWTPVPAALSRSAPCVGGWAFFASPTDAVADTPVQASNFHAISTLDCPLSPGWNMVADPFPAPALLPGGAAGYYWNTTRAAYEVVDSIPPGGAIWLYSATIASVSLRSGA